MTERWEVAVIGAGPAGLAAATVCARAGKRTVLFDEQPAPGGQIYRGITETKLRRDVLGADYWKGERLVEEFRGSGADYVPGATVWSLARDREIGVSVGGVARMLRAERVILATGALERPFPIPGWTLPGVMTAGAAQILLKSSSLVPEGRVVIAGCGPLLWLLACQFLDAGVALDAILDTPPRENRAAALPHLVDFLRSPYLAKGLRLLAAVRRRVRVIRVAELRAEGEGRVERVVYRTRGGREERRDVDLLLLHQGVVPNVNLAMVAGIEHRWDETQLCWSPVLDANGGSAVEGVWIAGDGAGIAGAEAAAERGRIAALAALGIDTEEARGALARWQRGRAFLDALYRPAAAFRRPRGDTLVCRCEEVTAAQVIETVALGVTGPNQMKSFLRCGMGPCQGRLCGLTVTELIAEARGLAPQDVGYYRLRPPVKPITLAELAALPADDAAVKAVVRS